MPELRERKGQEQTGNGKAIHHQRFQRRALPRYRVTCATEPESVANSPRQTPALA